MYIYIKYTKINLMKKTDKNTVSSSEQIEIAYQEQKYIEHRANNYLPQKLVISQIDFTRVEQKLYEMFVNQINYENLDPSRGLLVKIPLHFVKQYMTVEQIRETTAKMMEKKLTLFDVNHPEIEFRHLNIFHEISYNDKQSGVLEFKSTAAISELLFLGKQYAKYDFLTVLKFKHSYSTLLYKLLKIHIGQNRYNFIYSIAELKKLLNVSENIYKNLKDFKKYVLNTAMNEIKNSPTHPIDFEYFHHGNKIRNVTHLQFKIRTVFDSIKAEQADFLEAVSIDPKSVLANINNILVEKYQLKDKELNLILSSNQHIDRFVTLHIEFENGLHPQVKNKTAYMLACLGLVKKKQK